jgi:hypothetical protein
MNRLSKEAHIVEEINGVRCSVVEKNCSSERAEFLKKLLEHNGYTVIIAQTSVPVAKPSPKPPAQSTDSGVKSIAVAPPPPPNTFTVGVTDITFHAMLAVYERSLLTPEGKICSVAYWNQETEKENELYWMRRKK